MFASLSTTWENPNLDRPILSEQTILNLVAFLIVRRGRLRAHPRKSASSTPSLGVTISQGRNSLDSVRWISTMPGIFLPLIVVVVASFGDALRDSLDPRAR